MDYVELKKLIPKIPNKWNCNDIQKWLEFIGCEKYQKNFSDQSFDGSLWQELSEETLSSEFQIKEKLIRKKFMNCIFKIDQKGKNTLLPEYEEFLLNDPEFLQQNNNPPIIQQSIVMKQPEQNQQGGLEVYESIIINKNNEVVQNFARESIIVESFDLGSMQKKLDKQGTKDFQTTAQKHIGGLNEFFFGGINDNDKKVEDFKVVNQDEQYDLILTPNEDNKSSVGTDKFYTIKGNEITKIGRHSKNSIPILEESISRYHAEISKKDNNFYIQDIGSTSGTFIQIHSPLELNINVIVEFGSLQFLTRKIIQNENKFQLCIESVNQKQSFTLDFDSEITQHTVGRSQSNSLSFPDDPHLSNSHAKFFINLNQIYIQDIGSTNGTWLRLSSDKQVSQPYLIEDKMVFKLGQASSFNVRKIKIQ